MVVLIVDLKSKWGILEGGGVDIRDKSNSQRKVCCSSVSGRISVSLLNNQIIHNNYLNLIIRHVII